MVPVIILVALLVRLKLGAPLFFKKVRPGLNGNLLRDKVRLGITGWAQVNGRNAISWDE